MGKDAIIFDLKYTPYRPIKSASRKEKIAHAEERAFFNLTGADNILKYMTTEGKQAVKKESSKITALEYLQKNTGVFNDKGMISKEELTEMKERMKHNKGHIWHGFISLSENDSPKIDTPEKCIELVKRTFGNFFQEGSFHKDNMDLMCALHIDKPHHLHIHFCFWEKQPKTRLENGKLTYRNKGNVCKKAIDNMFVRIDRFISDENQDTYTFRDDALKKLREITKFHNVNASGKDVLREILKFQKDLPKEGRLSYGAKEFEPYRERVDRIVSMLLEANGEARNADIRFYENLERVKKKVEKFCKTNKMVDDGSGKFRYQIDEKNITVIEDIKKDYKRRQGNMIIKLVKAIDAEYYEREKERKFKTNCRKLKKCLTISKNIIKSIFKNFFLGFGLDSLRLERDFSNRLQEIEKEMEIEREKQKRKSKEENYKY